MQPTGNLIVTCGSYLTLEMASVFLILFLSSPAMWSFQGDLNSPHMFAKWLFCWLIAPVVFVVGGLWLCNCVCTVVAGYKKDAVNRKHISVHSLCWSDLHTGVTSSFKRVSFVEQCDDWCYFCAILCCSLVVCATVLKRPVYLGSLCFNHVELCCHSDSGCLGVEPQAHSCFVLSKS